MTTTQKPTLPITYRESLKLSLANVDHIIAQAEAAGTATESLYTERGKLRLQLLSTDPR